MLSCRNLIVAIKRCVYWGNQLDGIRFHSGDFMSLIYVIKGDKQECRADNTEYGE